MNRPARSYSGGFGIPMPDEGAPCDWCKQREGVPQKCPGDGANHGHGMSHTRAGDLAWLCPRCHELCTAEWNGP